MAELENEVLDDELEEQVSEEQEDEHQSSEDYSKEELRIFRDLKIDPETATTEDLRRMAKILAKTQDAVIKQKKSPTMWEAVTKTDLAIDKFVTRNPEYEGKESEISKYMSKGLSLEQATKLVEPDKTDENRNKTKQASITHWETWGTKTTYTKAELDDPKMSQEEYNRIMANIKAWKATLK